MKLTGLIQIRAPHYQQVTKVAVSKERVKVKIKCYLGQIKKISVFRVTGLKILGRVGNHIFFDYFFFSGKNTILCILKGN